MRPTLIAAQGRTLTPLTTADEVVAAYRRRAAVRQQRLHALCSPEVTPTPDDQPLLDQRAS